MLCKKKRKTDTDQEENFTVLPYILYRYAVLLLTYHIARRDLLLFTQSLSDTVRELGEENHVYKK